MYRFLIVTICLLLFSPYLVSGQAEIVASDKKGFQLEAFEARDLKGWNDYGQGIKAINHKQLMMSETDGSVGYMLESPKTYYGDVIVSYDIMALNAATVLIMELAAHNSQEYQLEFEKSYDGNVKYLFENVNMYMFAFHNAAHNKTGPFVRKWPKPGAKPLKAASKNAMHAGRYYHVEMGVHKGKLFFKIDGKRIFAVKDNSPYTGGKVLLRIRGTAHETASCLIKNVKIYSSKKN